MLKRMVALWALGIVTLAWSAPTAPVSATPTAVYIVSPSGPLPKPERLRIAEKRLQQWGFSVQIDPMAGRRDQRFAGSDVERLQALYRAAQSTAPVVMASRGGYGLTRLLSRIDWSLIAAYPKLYMGYSDFTAFNLALLAQTGMPSYTGPHAVGDFGADQVPHDMRNAWQRALRPGSTTLRFTAGAHSQMPAHLHLQGTLWGGNLSVLASLVGTPYLPTVENGILFLEEVGEKPYRVERLLTQLLHAGILTKQQAIVVGDISDYRLSAADYGYDIAQVWAWLAERTGKPIILGLPYGHAERRQVLPIGVTSKLDVQGNRVQLAFPHLVGSLPEAKP